MLSANVCKLLSMIVILDTNDVEILIEWLFTFVPTSSPLLLVLSILIIFSVGAN